MSATKGNAPDVRATEASISKTTDSKVGNDVKDFNSPSPSLATAPALTFNFAAQALRVVTIHNEPWFVAADACGALELENVSRACERLDDDERGMTTVHTPSGNQQMLIINESGLYSLIMTSRKAEAKKFKKWVTREVLPSIRKTGAYVQGNLAGMFQTQDSQSRIAALLQAADLFPRMLDSMERLNPSKRECASAANQLVQQATGLDFLGLAGNPHLNLDLFDAPIPTAKNQIDKLLAYIANGACYKENHRMACDLKHGQEIAHAKLLRLMHLKKETFAELVEQAIAQGLIARKTLTGYGGTVYALTGAAA